MNARKKKTINKLITGLEKDSTGATLYPRLQKVCYAPNVGYKSWIFKFRGVMVVLHDLGNGHYCYHRPANYMDLLLALIYEIWHMKWGVRR